MLTEYFLLAIKNLRKRRLRSWLTIIGIFISVATIFMLISLSLGLQGAVQKQFKSLGSDKFFVQPKTSFLAPPGGMSGVVLTQKDVDTISKIQGVKDYSYFTAGNAKVEFNGRIRYFVVWGVSVEHQKVFEDISSFRIIDGRNLRKGDSYSVVVGNSHLNGGLWSKPLKVRNKIEINGRKFAVKGVVGKIGNPEDDKSIMMNIKTFRSFFNIPKRIDSIIVQIDEGEDMQKITSKVEHKLISSRGLTEKTKDFEILTPEELMKSFSNILSIITIFLGGVAAISLFVGGIGIANTMYTSVLERTKEIGVMKAIGAKNKDIMIIFLIESGLLGLAGGIIGVCLGYGLSKLIEFIAIKQLGTTLLQAAAPLYLVLGCLGFGFLIGAVSGILPAIQASRTNVVDALHYE